MAATLPVLTWLGNAYAVLLGRHGDVTGHSRQAGCSRQAAYQQAAKVQQLVSQGQQPGPSRQQLLHQRHQLHSENQQLWQWLDQALDPPKAKQQQFAVTAAAMGLSLQQTLTLLAILLPPKRQPSRATLSRWVQHHARQARRLLAVLDDACRHLVLCLCLDEIFFHRQPVLMGIEPYSMAWLLGERASDRSGPTWAKALAAWPQVRDVAADGGSGIELGLARATRKRQEDATRSGTAVVPLRVRLDVFHIRREGERALRIVWSQAESLWQEADKTDRVKTRFDRGGGDGRRFNKGQSQQAWAKALDGFHQAQRQESAWRRAVAALEVWRADGSLNERSWAECEVHAAAEQLPGPRWAKVRRMLLDRRTLTFLDRLHEELTLAEPCPQRRAALVALWRWRPVSPAAVAEASSSAGVVASLLPSLVVRGLGAGWESSYWRVSVGLHRVVRASSAVECVNSVVRMHQARHRSLSQDLLDLKRLYWNVRSLVSGKRRGRCPYEHLGLKLSTYDPWALLHINPEELKQQLSSQKLAE
ncbi:MAG TPA: hypothetical protein VN688_10750 [Gemmataceae bacterium]|nr:hypothetical protein [Gemmataceae bacterium]